MDTPNTVADLAEDNAALRQAIVEIGLAQAEALNAIAEFIRTNGPPQGRTRQATAAVIADAAQGTLRIVEKMAFE